jgi:hypothetical protein
MIRINKGQVNDVILTLTEKATITNPDYLFKFFHQLTGEIKIFAASDLSTSTIRYNEFDIEETSTEDLYIGKVELKEGFHQYTIYEMTQASPADLDPDNAIGIVEVGKVLVTGTAQAIEYFDSNYVKDIPAYE